MEVKITAFFFAYKLLLFHMGMKYFVVNTHTMLRTVVRNKQGKRTRERDRHRVPQGPRSKKEKKKYFIG